MSEQRWLRLLPGRPHLLLFLGLAAVVVFVFGVIDLTFTGQALQGRYERAVTKVERLREQNLRLQQSLDQEQEGQHLPDRAWQYFGKAPRGAGVIIVEPESAPAAAPNVGQTTAKKPFWAALWDRLIQP